MGHMNVRHYFGRANEGLSVFLLRHGLSPRQLRERGLVVRARDQHLRFSRELRPNVPFSIHAGVVVERSELLTTYEELRTLQAEVSATVVSECALFDMRAGAPAQVPWPSALLESVSVDRCVVPPYAAVRGVTQAPLRTRLPRDQVVPLGVSPGYLGPVNANDCDAQGVMREAAFMGRIVDGIGHFFAALRGGQRPPGIGGAALEYRFVFHAWPRVSDIIEVRSALTAVTPKTMQVTHFVFDLETGECIANAQAVVVWFDLTARKAVAIPAEALAELQTQVVSGLSL
ncbi:MAG: hypothetical protein RL701_1005 [Pseudomonadota bacterium]